MQCITGNCSACLRVALNAICTTPLAALLGTDWLRFDSVLVRGNSCQRRERLMWGVDEMTGVGPQ